MLEELLGPVTGAEYDAHIIRIGDGAQFAAVLWISTLTKYRYDRSVWRETG